MASITDARQAIEAAADLSGRYSLELRRGMRQRRDEIASETQQLLADIKELEPFIERGLSLPEDRDSYLSMLGRRRQLLEEYDELGKAFIQLDLIDEDPLAKETVNIFGAVVVPE